MSARNVADVNTLPNLSETISKLRSLCDPRFGLAPRHNPAKASVLLPVKLELALILARAVNVNASANIWKVPKIQLKIQNKDRTDIKVHFHAYWSESDWYTNRFLTAIRSGPRPPRFLFLSTPMK